jgi:hypothetical protein
VKEAAITISRGGLAMLAVGAFASGQPPDAYQAGGVIDLISAPNSFVHLTNNSSGAICANTYVFNTSRQLLACCATLVAPNQLNYLSTGSLVHDYSLSAPDAVSISFVASTIPGPSPGFPNGTCNSAAPAFGDLVSGMQASLSGVSFQKTQLSATELQALTSGCEYLQAYSSGLGICSSASVARTLTVTKAGTGTGTISGGGIDCGATCSATPPGMVGLTATAQRGSEFVGWTGACSGRAPCNLNMFSSDQAVTAVFTDILPLWWLLFS